MSEEKSNSMNKYQLKKLIKKLEGIRGRNTELVSLYIPAGYDMSKISDFVTSEASEAESIKSKHTRKNVQGALEKIARKVSEEHETPENGVVLFAGNVSETEGRPDIQIWEVHPPQTIESRRYRCDKEFVLEPLKQMIVDDRVYGLIVLDKNEAAIGYLQGSSIKTEYKMSSEVPGKTRAGGQSAQRFARIRKQMLKTFMKDINDNAKTAFLEKAREGKLLGILVGGPGWTKDKFVDEYMHQELKDELIDVKSLNYSGEEALEELVEKAEESLQDASAVKEKNLVESFFENLKEENGKSEYGLKQVIKAMDMGAVDTVLISEDFNHYRATYICGNEHEKEVYEEEAKISENVKCDECGEQMDLEQMTDIVDIMDEKAEQMGSSLELISTDHEQGRRLYNMGGIAAILRYRIR
ncbi:peptide chain release factor aRF-1 [Candidatus Nanohalococcus occultus]|uniref:Peptide chain release factor subunit 1 n=1 Tax=Candidatus Nanohalococcus occultus TaxID=2978047 RepID=A0ABY8CG06_9ARCH|nr:Peptide chain release factor eRF1 [Candidatus Nanohaloarchaeota archaeon SVXNc]